MPRRDSFRVTLFAFAAISLLFAGCGPWRPATAKVSGVVLLDGEPVPEAAVTFVPEAGGRPASASTDAEGRFELTTFEQGDGAILGEHLVTVYKQEQSGVLTTDDGLDGGTGRGGLKITWLVPEKYASRATSDLRETVTRGMGPVEIRLSSEP